MQGERWKLLRKNQKKMLNIKNTVTEIKNVFDVLIQSGHTQERNNELEDLLMKTSQNEIHGEKRLSTTEQTIQELGQLQKAYQV